MPQHGQIAGRTTSTEGVCRDQSLTEMSLRITLVMSWPAFIWSGHDGGGAFHTVPVTYSPADLASAPSLLGRQSYIIGCAPSLTFAMGAGIGSIK